MPSSQNAASSERAAATGRRGAVADGSLFALSGLLAAYLLWHLLDYAYGRDQALYSLAGDALLRGEAPYRAVWDFKPPGIYVLYALARALFGANFTAIRILEALSLLSLGAAFAIFSRRHVATARAGVLGGTLAILASVPLGFWYTAQPESFGGVALAWALVCASWAPARTAGSGGAALEFAAWAAAAALYATAALLKPPLGGGIAVSFAFVVVRRHRQAPRRGWWRAAGAPAAAFAAGGALPMLATWTFFAARGALSDLQGALFVFAPHYTALQFEALSGLDLTWQTLRGWLLRTAPYNLAGLGALAALPVLAPREREGLLHVLGVIACSLLGVGLQAKFFSYHFGAVYLLTALLAGWGFWKLWIRARSSLAGVLALAAALAALHLGAIPGLPSLAGFWERSGQWLRSRSDPVRHLRVRDALYSFGDVDARSNRLAAAWLAQHTAATARLFVWGFEPVLYELAGRRPASRYVYNAPQRASWSMDASRKVLMAELQAAPPEAIVVVREDRLPLVTGNRLDSFETLQEFAALRELLRQRYRFAVRVGDLEILLRDDLAEPP